MTQISISIAAANSLILLCGIIFSTSRNIYPSTRADFLSHPIGVLSDIVLPHFSALQICWILRHQLLVVGCKLDKNYSHKCQNHASGRYCLNYMATVYSQSAKFLGRRCYGIGSPFPSLVCLSSVASCIVCRLRQFGTNFSGTTFCPSNQLMGLLLLITARK